jgi:hypothetical protein
MRIRVLNVGVRPAAVAAAVGFGVLVFPATPLGAVPSRPATLAGETLTASDSGSSYFVPGSCYSGGPMTSSFSFTGTAAGPYPGTFTETGTMTYTLGPVPDGQMIASGTVTQFSAKFTITSSAGKVTGTRTLDPTVATSRGARCYESGGGTSYETDPLPTRYTARITTGKGRPNTHGPSSAVLASAVGFGGSVMSSNVDDKFASPPPPAPAPAQARAQLPAPRHQRS